jgi:hypothetical protein
MPFPGIVTDLDFPQWSGMSVEEMMDDVADALAKEKAKAEALKGVVIGSWGGPAAPNIFVDKPNQIIYEG